MTARDQVIKKLFDNATFQTQDIKFFPGCDAKNNSDAFWNELLSALEQEEKGTATITDAWPDLTPKRGIEQITLSH